MLTDLINHPIAHDTRLAAPIVSAANAVSPIRYPGGKQRQLSTILTHLQPAWTQSQRFVEPFVGGGAVFFGLAPERAWLADLNLDLITLYRGIRRSPTKVWQHFVSFESTREGYYSARARDRSGLCITERAALTLYLNRTCFKGMWRVNKAGRFNVGYGGEDRRWAITLKGLREVARCLGAAKLTRGDFEPVVDACVKGDLMFVDPPYSPGELEPRHDHYVFSQFALGDHLRLANALHRATHRSVLWALTTTAHPQITGLFSGDIVIPLHFGTSRRPGITERNPGEVLICNYDVRGQK